MTYSLPLSVYPKAAKTRHGRLRTANRRDKKLFMSADLKNKNTVRRMLGNSLEQRDEQTFYPSRNRNFAIDLSKETNTSI
jgi:hypothetical protein